MTEELPPAQRGRRPLTERELEVVRLIAEGLSAREAAARLHRSSRTVENHLRSAYRKLGVRNRVEMMREAEAQGYLRTEIPPARRTTGCLLGALQAVEVELAEAHGADYFPVLAAALSRTLGSRWAGVSRVLSDQAQMEIVAAVADGEPFGASRVALETSPCAEVVRTGTLTLSGADAAAYSGLASLSEGRAAAYVGVRLQNPRLRYPGVLWVLHDGPLPNEPPAQAVLEFHAARAAAELAIREANLPTPPR